jgi:hypothetical protein
MTLAMRADILVSSLSLPSHGAPVQRKARLADMIKEEVHGWCHRPFLVRQDCSGPRPLGQIDLQDLELKAARIEARH